MDTRKRTEEKVFSFVEEHHMLEAGDRVVAGISGGADSVCLLFVLLEYRRKVPFEMAVVHVNHGIRKEAQEDLFYVERLCREFGIVFYPYYEDVRRLIKEQSCTEEEAGRVVRYRAFDEAAKDFKANKIAVAHNSNDRAETMLFNLFRGSGIRGLGSIRPVRDHIIRPILCLERGEIESYLAERGVSYCHDKTNETDDYTRNRIRHHILPYAEKEITQGCVEHMAQSAELLNETEEYLEEQTAEAMKRCCEVLDSGNLADNDSIQSENAESDARTKAESGFSKYAIDIELFLKQHKVIQKRMLYTIARSLSPGGKNITHTHISDLMSLFRESANRSVDLPFGIVGRRQYDEVLIERDTKKRDDISRQETTCIPVAALSEEENRKILLNDGRELELQIFSREEALSDFPRNQYTKWFDCDKIKQELVLRTRQTGDYLTIAGNDGQMIHKSVKDYMITEKIPSSERDHMLLLAEGPHVVWLIGYRISEYYKVDRNTKCILQVQLQ